MRECDECEGEGFFFDFDASAPKGTLYNPYTEEDLREQGIDVDEMMEDAELLDGDPDFEKFMQDYFVCDKCGGSGWI